MDTGCLAFLGTACLAFLCCIWEPVKEALLGCLRTTVADSLTRPREGLVEAITSRTVLWGNRIQRLPSSTLSMVGRKQLLSDIQGLLKGDGKGIIGLYGMGGVGKTTLLIEINNKLFDSRDSSFDVVIWVTVSKDKTVFMIQEDIGVRLGFSRAGEDGSRKLPTHEDDRRRALDQALFGKKFLLLLDDMWEEVNLLSVGVPLPSNGAKIVLTTRSLDVCVEMKAEAKVRVGYLNEEISWKLFCSKVGEEVDLKEGSFIRPRAKSIVKKCGGVPLALITAGVAMSGETSNHGWDDAVLKLNQSPHEFIGEVMEKQVFSVLKLSFDRLSDQWARQCLLYCSLFPEDHDISTGKLIELWVGEGFLDSDSGNLDSDSRNQTSLYEARDKGKRIIDKLKKACLLEDGGHGHVRLHDLVREMALRLTNKTYKTFVFHGSHEKLLGGSAEVESWEDATRISMLVQGDDFGMPCPTRECPKLITFLILETIYFRFSSVPPNLIAWMQAVRVLDLTRTPLSELPSAIGLLVQLRHLNLSWTDVKSLPEEMGQLVKLSQLNLSKTLWLKKVPRAALVTLTSLQSLNLIGCAYAYEMTIREEDGMDGRDGVCLRDLEDNLGRLEELGLDIVWSQPQCLQHLVNSQKFQRCTRQLRISDLSDLTVGVLSVASERLRNLESLKIERCDRLEGVWRVDSVTQLQRLKVLHLFSLEGLTKVEGDFLCLKKLSIGHCPQLNDLNCVGRLPRLEELSIIYCEGIVELSVGDQPTSFPMLREMELYTLTELTSISKGTLVFPSLERLTVKNCPRLSRLPLGLNSGQKMRLIYASREWWDALEWDNSDTHDGDHVKSAFTPYFVSLGQIFAS